MYENENKKIIGLEYGDRYASIMHIQCPEYDTFIETENKAFEWLRTWRFVLHTICITANIKDEKIVAKILDDKSFLIGVSGVGSRTKTAPILYRAINIMRMNKFDDYHADPKPFILCPPFTDELTFAEIENTLL